MSGECIESGERAGECLANVSSPGKVVGECRANVSSPTHFPKKSILASTRIRQTGEFSASTRIRQIRRRVAIAYKFVKLKKNAKKGIQKSANFFSPNKLAFCILSVLISLNK